MSVRLKILIAVLALGLSAFAILGDAFFRGMGLPANSGRIVVAGVLSIIGLVWFFWSSVNMRADSRTAKRKDHNKTKPGA